MASKDFKVSYRASDDGFGSTTTKAAAQLRMLGREAEGLAGRELLTLQQGLAGIFTIGFLKGKIDEAIQFADRMRSLSDMTQISVESLQEMEYAAKQAGSPFEAIIAAIRNLERTRVSALGGNKPDLASFERLAVTVENLKSLSGEQLFKQIAASIHDGTYSAQQLNDVLNLMGRGATQLFPLFNAGLQELTEKARTAGVVMKENLINRLDELGDQVDETKGRFSVGFAIIAGNLATAWNRLSRITEVGDVFRRVFTHGWGVAKDRLDNLNSGPGWMAAKEAWPTQFAEAFRQAVQAARSEWARLIGDVSAPGTPNGGLNDQASFEAEQNQKAAELKLKNDEREKELALKALPIEERKNRLIERRLELLREMSYAQNALATETAREQLNKVNEELLTLQSALNAAQPNPGSANDIKGANLQRNLDDLSRAGFFTNGSPVALGNIQADQLKELKEIVSQLRKAPAETARAL